MDFLDPKKKRAHKIRLYVGYLLMAIALSIGTLILLFEAYGYGVDRKTGEVIQNGMVFVDAHPEQAQIYVNGKHEGQTDTRLILPAGRYTVELRRDGYRTWSRTFELQGGSIERLVYPYIFPETLDPTDVQLYGQPPALITQSPDKRWLMVMQSGKLDSFELVDLSSSNHATTTAALPSGLLDTTAGIHKFESIEWAADNRHVLVRHTFKGANEFLMIDRQRPAESYNITATFGISPTQVQLRDKKFDQLYLLESKGGILRAGAAKTKKLSLLASRVLAFKPYGADVMLYITEAGAPANKAVVNLRRGEEVFKVRDLPKAGAYVADLTRYDDRWYVAVGTDVEKKAYIYKEPLRDLTRETPRLPAPVAVLKLQQLEFLSFSANTRFVGVQGGGEFAVYDAEHDRQYRFDTKLKMPAGQKAVWMDGHRYVVVAGDKVTIFDYDGSNLQQLSGANATFLPIFDRDYNALYTIAPSVEVKGRSALVRTVVRTPADL